MNEKVYEDLKKIVGDDWVIKEKELMERYLKDETVPSLVPKVAEESIVVKPENTEEISELMKYANENIIPIIPRGSGTGLVAGVVPTEDSIILSTERLNKIIDLDKKNYTITCEAGVTLEKLIETLEEDSDLFFPIHPGDEGATLGGMVINNAGGAKAVKHGVMRNHVRGVKFITPTGEIMKLGGKTLKNVAGSDLLHLIIGSEGTLGIISEVTLSVEPEPEFQATLLVGFNERKSAISAVPELMKTGNKPLAVEYIERDMAEMAADHLGETWPLNKGEVDLMIVLAENDQDLLYNQAMRIEEICQEFGSVESVIAERKEDQESILTIRSNIDTATKKEDLADDVDAAVPPAYIDEFLNDLLEIFNEYDAKLSAYGHAADGNLHIYIYKEDGHIPEYYQELKERFYKTALKYGGTIAAEHGIGKTKKADLPLQLNEFEINLMRKIKNVFDPNNIMNPDTIF